MIYPLIGWLCYQLEAPWWVWGLLILEIAKELHALPLYFWLIRKYKREGRGGK